MFALLIILKLIALSESFDAFQLDYVYIRKYKERNCSVRAMVKSKLPIKTITCDGSDCTVINKTNSYILSSKHVSVKWTVTTIAVLEFYLDFSNIFPVSNENSILTYMTKQGQVIKTSEGLNYGHKIGTLSDTDKQMMSHSKKPTWYCLSQKNQHKEYFRYSCHSFAKINKQVPYTIYRRRFANARSLFSTIVKIELSFEKIPMYDSARSVVVKEGDKESCLNKEANCLKFVLMKNNELILKHLTPFTKYIHKFYFVRGSQTFTINLSFYTRQGMSHNWCFADCVFESGNFTYYGVRSRMTKNKICKVVNENASCIANLCFDVPKDLTCLKITQTTYNDQIKGYWKQPPNHIGYIMLLHQNSEGCVEAHINKHNKVPKIIQRFYEKCTKKVKKNTIFNSFQFSYLNTNSNYTVYVIPIISDYAHDYVIKLSYYTSSTNGSSHFISTIVVIFFGILAVLLIGGIYWRKRTRTDQPVNKTRSRTRSKQGK